MLRFLHSIAAGQNTYTHAHSRYGISCQLRCQSRSMYLDRITCPKSFSLFASYFFTLFSCFSPMVIWFCLFVSLRSNKFQNISFFSYTLRLWGSIPKWNENKIKGIRWEGHGEQNLYESEIFVQMVSLLTVTYCAPSWWDDVSKSIFKSAAAATTTEYEPNKVESEFWYFGTSNDKRQHPIQFNC